MKPAPLSIAILAAGSSSRLGEAKQLVQFRGQTLLDRVVQTALSLDPAHVVVVVPSPWEVPVSLQRPPLTWLHHAHAALGMGSSLSLANASCPATHALLVLLCDQPFLTSSHLRALLQIAEGPAATAYPEGGAGVPVLFPPQWRAALGALAPDQGAKQILLRLQTVTTLVQPDYSLFDLDTPADLIALRALE